MKLHYLQHVRFESIGYIEQWAIDNKCIVAGTQLYKDAPLPVMNDFDVLVVMGGPMGVGDTDVYPWLDAEKKFIADAIENRKKVIGICLGAQLIADVLGAKVYRNVYPEIGFFDVGLASDIKNSIFFNGFPDSFKVFQWHSDTFEIPDKAIRIAGSEVCENQAFEYQDNVIALQFHLESTVDSIRQLICNCRSELVDSPYIHSEDQINKNMDLIKPTNSLMKKLLDDFVLRC